MEHHNSVLIDEERGVIERKNLSNIRRNYLPEKGKQRKRIRDVNERSRVTKHSSHNKRTINTTKDQTKRLKGTILFRRNYAGVVRKTKYFLPARGVKQFYHILGSWIDCIKAMKCQKDHLMKLLNDNKVLEEIHRTIDTQLERIERRVELYSLMQDLKKTNGG